MSSVLGLSGLYRKLSLSIPIYEVDHGPCDHFHVFFYCSAPHAACCEFVKLVCAAYGCKQDCWRCDLQDKKGGGTGGKLKIKILIDKHFIKLTLSLSYGNYLLEIVFSLPNTFKFFPGSLLFMNTPCFHLFEARVSAVHLLRPHQLFVESHQLRSLLRPEVGICREYWKGPFDPQGYPATPSLHRTDVASLCLVGAPLLLSESCQL